MAGLQLRNGLGSAVMTTTIFDDFMSGDAQLMFLILPCKMERRFPSSIHMRVKAKSWDTQLVMPPIMVKSVEGIQDPVLTDIDWDQLIQTLDTERYFDQDEAHLRESTTAANQKELPDCQREPRNQREDNVPSPTPSVPKIPSAHD
eukprot:15347549-Ditylum_brightwellii.AAC.1